MSRALWLVVALGVFAQGCAIDEGEDRINFCNSTTVAAGETAYDVVCIGCSIRVDGTIEGDAVAVLGNITVNGTIEGDAVAAGGDLTLGPGAGVGGDAVAVGGYLVADPTASFGGEVVNEGTFVHLPGQRAFHVRGMLRLVGVSVALALIGSAPCWWATPRSQCSWEGCRRRTHRCPSSC